MGKSTDTETWAPIPDWPGYEASDRGRVRSLDRWVECTNGHFRRYRGRVLRPSPAGRGYLHVAVCAGDAALQKKRHIEHLVLEAFVGPRPPGMYSCHNDGNPANNHLSNLRWDTSSSNSIDRVMHGRDHHAVRELCPRNHPLVEPNLVECQLRLNGTRACKACAQARSKIFYEERCGRVAPDLKRLADDKYAVIMAGAAVT